MKNTIYKLILFIAILSIVLPSCGGGAGGAAGGGGSSGATYGGTSGKLVMNINWPAPTGKNASKYIPATTDKITIDITGNGLSSTQHYEYSKPSSGQVTANITLPVGEKTAEIKALNASGEILAYRISSTVVVSNQISSVNANLGTAIKDTGFTPQNISVVTGTTLLFVNNGSIGHSVTAIGGAFDSGLIVVGGSWSYTFSTAGTFAYKDNYNNSLTGTITVTDSSTPPSPPSNLTALAVSSSRIDLAWTDNSTNETGFKIERKTGLGGTYAEIAIVSASVTSYNNTELSAGVNYYYRVRAYNDAGNSAYSNEANAITTPDNPEWRVQAGIPDVGLINSVWANNTNDVFAAGADGNMLHYNGVDWSLMVSSTVNSLYGVWGSSGSDVFAVGDGGTIIHYNGAAWAAMDSGTVSNLTGAWGSSGSNVIAVGATSRIYHYDGAAWTWKNAGAFTIFFAVWGSAPDNAFAVGKSGVIYKYDGAAWAAMDSGTGSWLYGVWGSSGTDVFAVGRSGAILHYDGAAWAAMDSGTVEHLMKVWGTASNDVFAVGNNGVILHYNGTAWTTVDSGTANGLFGIWGTASNNVYAVGDLSTILRYSN